MGQPTKTGTVGVRPYSPLDYLFKLLGFLGLAIPSFLLGLLVLYFGFVYFNANIGGLFSPEYVDAPWSGAKLTDLFKHLPVPAVILGGVVLVIIYRLLQESAWAMSSLLEALKRLGARD